MLDRFSVKPVMGSTVTVTAQLTKHRYHQIQQEPKRISSKCDVVRHLNVAAGQSIVVSYLQLLLLLLLLLLQRLLHAAAAASSR